MKSSPATDVIIGFMVNLWSGSPCFCCVYISLVQPSCLWLQKLLSSNITLKLSPFPVKSHASGPIWSTSPLTISTSHNETKPLSPWLNFASILSLRRIENWNSFSSLLLSHLFNRSSLGLKFVWPPSPAFHRPLRTESSGGGVSQRWRAGTTHRTFAGTTHIYFRRSLTVTLPVPHTGHLLYPPLGFGTTLDSTTRTGHLLLAPLSLSGGRFR